MRTADTIGPICRFCSSPQTTCQLAAKVTRRSIHVTVEYESWAPVDLRVVELAVLVRDPFGAVIDAFRMIDFEPPTTRRVPSTRTWRVRSAATEAAYSVEVAPLRLATTHGSTYVAGNFRKFDDSPFKEPASARVASLVMDKLGGPTVNIGSGLPQA